MENTFINHRPQASIVFDVEYVITMHVGIILIHIVSSGREKWNRNAKLFQLALKMYMLVALLLNA